MKVICGLGNPGREYERHRHNVGFRVAALLAERAGATLRPGKFDALSAQGQLGAQKILFVLPQTYMNLSGRSVAPAARFYKVAPEDMLVIHDEVDLPFGRLQLKAGGGAAGHNGLKSIVADLGEESFGRLRFGVGKPEGGKDRVPGHVLSAFLPDEEAQLSELLSRAADAAADWVEHGLATAMNRHNRRS